MSHAAVPLAVGLGLGKEVISRRLLLAGVAASMIPDLDVYMSGLVPGIGHRGVTHTLVFALIIALTAALFAEALCTTRLAASAFIFVATASHPLLDAFTNGGGGILFFWPMSDHRYFMPVRPIEVSPIGIGNFLSRRGVDVLVSELKWVWSGAALLGLALHVLRRSYPRGAA